MSGCFAFLLIGIQEYVLILIQVVVVVVGPTVNANDRFDCFYNNVSILKGIFISDFHFDGARAFS